MIMRRLKGDPIELGNLEPCRMVAPVLPTSSSGMTPHQNLQLITDLTYACETGDVAEIKEVMDQHFYSLQTARCIFCVNDEKYEREFLPESRSFGGKGYLHSFMASRRVMTMKNRGEGETFQYTYTISFDTQFPSYLRSRARGDTVPNLDDEISECLRYLAPHRSGTDITPYLHENQERLETAPVRDTIRAFIEFKSSADEPLTQDGGIQTTLSAAEVEKQVDGTMQMVKGADWQASAAHAKRNWAVSYIMLLVAAAIHLRHPSQTPTQRLVHLLEHLDQVGFFPKVEIHFIHTFFEQGNQERFFRHIQSNARELTRKLANMAWDLSHKRTIFDQVSAVARGDHRHADFVVPYILTFDQPLEAVLRGYQANALITYLQGGSKFITIYPLDVEARLHAAFESRLDLLSPDRKAERLERGRVFFAEEARRDELIQDSEALLASALPAPTSLTS